MQQLTPGTIIIPIQLAINSAIDQTLLFSVRKDQKQIAKAEFYNIVVSLFLHKWLLDNSKSRTHHINGAAYFIFNSVNNLR